MKIPTLKKIVKRLTVLPTGRYQFRTKIDGVNKKHSPETLDKETAAKRVQQWLEELAAGNYDTVTKLERKEKKVMTFQHCLSIYEREAEVKESTIIGNRCCYKRLLRENNLKLTDPVSKLTAQVLKKWVKSCVGRFGDDEEKAKRKDKAASILRCALSIWADKLLQYYELPEGWDVLNFKVSQTKIKGWAAATDGRYEKAFQYFDSIKDSDPQLFIAFKLMAEYGLRNSEASRAKHHWLLPHVFSVLVSKVDGKPRDLPYQSESDRELFESHNKEGEHILAGSKTERTDKVWRRLNAKLTELGFTNKKKAYDLRKYFGSQVALQTKSVWLAAEMLGNTPEVAKANYVSMLKTPAFNIRKGAAA